MNDCVHIKFVQCHPLFYCTCAEVQGDWGQGYFVYRLIYNNLSEAVKVKGQSIRPPQELNKTSIAMNLLTYGLLVCIAYCFTAHAHSGTMSS